MADRNGRIPFGPVRNADLFSNHWLERRLPLEPEWAALRDEARACLDKIADLWARQRDLVERYGAEAPLETAWIQPVLGAFGWHFVTQPLIRNRKPDYALFVDTESLDAAVNSGRDSPDFWKFPRIVADAKAWGVPLDRRTTGAVREFPPEQIAWYLDKAPMDWGILTNGRLWRLIPRTVERNQRHFETYLELNLETVMERWTRGFQLGVPREKALDEFLPWFLLATPVAFRPEPRVGSLIERATTGSTAYATRVGDSLRDQVFEALRLCIEGFLAHKPNNLDPERDLADCRLNSFTLLFRLIFILFAEDRQLLPLGINANYTRNRSLTGNHREHLQAIESGLLSRTSTGFWQHWQSLFDLIDRGHATYGVPTYNGGLFDQDSHPFLNANALPDSYAGRVLDALRRAPDPDGEAGDRVNVDYRDLAIQNLGSIYEALLELHPRYANEPMVVVRKRDRGKIVERTIPTAADPEDGFEPTDTTHARGEVYLETDKGERRATGSYYTPDHIVRYIVDNTLGPLCKEVDAALTADITAAEEAHKRARGENRAAAERDLERLRSEYDDRILRLTVLDPAMGSGHFLIAAIQFLASEIATNPHSRDVDEPAGEGDESTLRFWKRRVVERCIFGVDKNPIAVELAKLALWLETVSRDEPLSFLDHHLRHGDSLIGARVAMLGQLADPRAVETGGLFTQAFEGRIPALLKPFEDMRKLASNTVAQVKQKEALFRKAYAEVREPFAAVADLWLSPFFTPDDAGEVTTPQYDQALKGLSDRQAFKRAIAEAWFTDALKRVRVPEVQPFHWELEFPEVFLSPERVRAGRTGFDAIIGNPPYDVLAEKELAHGKDEEEAKSVGVGLRSLKRFLAALPVYDPSRTGKNNLYKLFICRSLDLLGEGGRFGFIVPMAVLGDEQATSIRRAMLGSGAFLATEGFPQKDDPTKRVFPEAKLSTAIFIYQKSAQAEAPKRPFVSRQHPARDFDSSAPSTTLTGEAIPQYDPSNLTILSCSQDDWTLAVRIAASPRTTRFGSVAQFSQGEINETVQKAAGVASREESKGRKVIRGAGICLYVAREASQGHDLFLDIPAFLEGKGPDTKAFHHRFPRIGVQESSPQNNFRRIISAMIPAGEFCNHKINYVPEPDAKAPLEVVLAILNSALADWYFRLGSTNGAVSHYQLHNLPFPRFAEKRSDADAPLAANAIASLRAGRLDEAFDTLRPALAEPPFPLAVQEVMVEAVKRIIAIEKDRGEIARTDRSALDPKAQPLQRFLDRLIYAMAGLTDDEARGLEDRLSRML